MSSSRSRPTLTLMQRFSTGAIGFLMKTTRVTSVANTFRAKSPSLRQSIVTGSSDELRRTAYFR
jgi:hypothetical protein